MENNTVTQPNVKYDVLSPDGISIHPSDVYDSPDAARAAFDQWKKRYEKQGYYSSPSAGRIPLKELGDHCWIVPVDSSDDEQIETELSDNNSNTI